jgi:hypothetical protein
MTNGLSVEIDGATGEVTEYTPTGKPSRYRCKLDTMQDVRREMAKLYRETRSGLLDVQDATKLTWCLQTIGKVIESEKGAGTANSAPSGLGHFYGEMTDEELDRIISGGESVS